MNFINFLINTLSDRLHISKNKITKALNSFVFPTKKINVPEKSAPIITNYEYTWHGSNPMYYDYLATNLGYLYRYSLKTCKKEQDVVDFFIKILCKNKINTTEYEYMKKIVRFCIEEDNDYGFSPICFTVVRFERALETKMLDFIVTKCVEVDLRNYMLDNFT